MFWRNKKRHIVPEKLSPLPLSPQVTVRSGAEIITLLQTSSFWWIRNQNFFCFNTKHAVVVNQTSYWCRNQNARVFFLITFLLWLHVHVESKKVFLLKILLNFWMVASVLLNQCSNQNVFYRNQGQIWLCICDDFSLLFLISIY